MDEALSTSGAFLSVLAGVLLLIYWYGFALFMPYSQLSTTLSLLMKKNRHWNWINAVGMLGAITGLLGQFGLLIFHQQVEGNLLLYGFYLSVIGTILLISTMSWETIIWPILVKSDESLLDFDGSIYTAKTFLPFFVISGLIYGLGFALFGFAIYRAQFVTPISGILLAVGAPLFSSGSLFGKYQVYPRTFGVSLLCVGLIWIGLEILGIL